MAGRSVVLAYVESYAWADLQPFVRTLSASGYEGDVVFYTSDLPDSCTAHLSRNGIDQIPVRRLNLKGAYPYRNWLRGGRPATFIPDISVNRRLSSFLDRLDLVDTGLGNWVARTFWHCQSARFLYFREFLRSHPTYEQILICDVRDVAFQAPPFSEPTDDRLHVYEEYAQVRLGEQANNASWVESLYGRKGLERLQDFPILCVGVLHGGRTAVIRAVDAICREVVERYRGWGTDQGVFNYLVRTEQIGNVVVHSFGEGCAMHLGIAPRAAIPTDSQGRVLNRAEEVCAIVHQYDRHDDLSQSFLGRTTMAS